MKQNVDTEIKDHKFNGVGKVPFPHASLTTQQREEQAFYENNSGDGIRSIFQLFRRFYCGVKAPSKVCKRKLKLE